MKYAIIFAATAAAHQAYGGYGEYAPSSASVKPSTTAKPIGYTTIVPGYGKQPVTVTTQNQPYPTCVSATAAYGTEGCAQWKEDTYVSTVIKDYDNNYATVTNTEQPVIVYHTKTTITHSATGTGGYAAPTGAASKNGTEGCWYELYEKIEEVPYKELGPNALHGYPGSGLYSKGDKEQPVHVKEYKGGKWSEYDHVYSYGTPKPEVKVYEKPGVYVVPSKDVVVQYPVDHPAEATTTAKAGETCTYGGQSVQATQTGYITAPYAAYETTVQGGSTVTETVIQYTTIYASTTGNYQVTKPTTTVYDHDVEVTYPTAQHYDAGVYHQPAQTVTITSAGQAYTCEYEKTKATPSPIVPGYNKPVPSAMSPQGGKYPSQSAKPAHNGTAPAYGSYPASSPVAAVSKPAYNGGNHYGANTMSTMVTVPVKPYATPSGKYPVGAVSSSAPAEYSVASASSTPCDTSSTPAAYQTQPAAYTPSVPAAVSSSPAVYSSAPAEYSVASASSTPCETSATPSATPAAYKPATPAASSPAAYQPAPAVSSPAAYQPAPAASSPAAYQPATPAAYQPAPAASSPAAYQPAPAASSPAAYQPAPAASSPAAYESSPYQATPSPATNEYEQSDNSYGSTDNQYEQPKQSYNDYPSY
jgi:hypothetical protein